jgi:plasmid stabilization system protein ParE
VSYRLRLQPEARDDIRSAARWYNKQRRGLGEEFVQEVEASLSVIREQPYRFPIMYRHFRRTLLHRFPYGISFAVVDDTIQVVACLHVRRDPETWTSRG